MPYRSKRSKPNERESSHFTTINTTTKESASFTTTAAKEESPMNAKALRRAAERVKYRLEGEMLECLNNPDYHKEYGGSIEEERECVEYIFATVREDDDEPVTYENLCSIKKPYMENRKIWWNFDGFTVSVNSSGARFRCNHMPIASAQTMGQFRSLCRGLGIVLKEVNRAE